MDFRPRISDCGDTALLLEFDAVRSITLSLAILHFAEKLQAAFPQGLKEVIPAFSSLTLIYDPLLIGRVELLRVIDGLSMEDARERAPQTLWKSPVQYTVGPEREFAQ